MPKTTHTCMPIELTDKEATAIKQLKALASHWPKSLWLFSANGSLNVMKCTPEGKHATLPSQGMDPAYVVATADIPNDGGDW